MPRRAREEEPDEVAVVGQAGRAGAAEPLWRGLFKVNTYEAHLSTQADFASLAPLQPHAEHAGGRLQCTPPTVLLAVSDVRGVRSATLSADGRVLAVAPGTTNPAYPHGLHASLDRDMAAQPLSLHLELDLVGTGQLAWVPAAESTRWTLASDWPHPSFGGQFSPTQREVRADGFSATWMLSSLATPAPSDVGKGLGLCMPASLTGEGGDAVDDAGAKPDKCLDLMAVGFIDPVNPYVLSDRAIKYDLLFVALTFVAVGLVEVLAGRCVLVIGSVMLFAALAAVMLLTRRIDWYALFGRLRAVPGEAT